MKSSSYLLSKYTHKKEMAPWFSYQNLISTSVSGIHLNTSPTLSLLCSEMTHRKTILFSKGLNPDAKDMSSGHKWCLVPHSWRIMSLKYYVGNSFQKCGEGDRSQSYTALSVWPVHAVYKVDDFGLPGSSEETVEMAAHCCLGQKLKWWCLGLHPVQAVSHSQVSGHNPTRYFSIYSVDYLDFSMFHLSILVITVTPRQ